MLHKDQNMEAAITEDFLHFWLLFLQKVRLYSIFRKGHSELAHAEHI